MEEIAPKHTTLEESINEFKQIAKDYLEWFIMLTYFIVILTSYIIQS